MSRLFETYRAAHEQGFIPIFVDDDSDSKMLLDACLEAGMKVIEYTLRRRDAHRMIPWIRENYPDLYLLAGSTLDSEQIVRRMRRKHPQLLTIAELDAMGVDGFVSMIGWSEASIRRYSSRRVVIPTAATVNEAFFQVDAGAHFVKLAGPGLDLVRRCRMAAAFDYCPIMLTGGITASRIPAAVAAGAVLVAAGFDVIAPEAGSGSGSAEIARSLRRYLDVTRTVREKTWPEMVRNIGAARQDWLDSLPHYHPFTDRDRA